MSLPKKSSTDTIIKTIFKVTFTIIFVVKQFFWRSEYHSSTQTERNAEILQTLMNDFQKKAKVHIGEKIGVTNEEWKKLDLILERMIGIQVSHFRN